MKEFSTREDLKGKSKEISKFASKIMADVKKMPEKRRENMLKIKGSNEKEVIEEAKDFLEERFDAQIAVYDEEDDQRYDPRQKAVMAMPSRPAIYIE
jgi:hypothetical protein